MRKSSLLLMSTRARLGGTCVILSRAIAPDVRRVSRAPPAARIAYLPQQSELDRNVPVRVHELVCLGAW